MLKIGTVIYEPTIVDGFDMNVYYSKRVDGILGKPAKAMYNDITCFVDAKAIRENPDLVAVSPNGQEQTKPTLCHGIFCAQPTKSTEPMF